VTGLFLHHYPGSPFSEKVRLMLGLKGLAWRSVIVPSVSPKPDLAALTGGYRRAPVLQTGADVWCDSALISRVLDAIEPARPLHRADRVAGEAVALWADRDLFGAVVACMFQPANLEALFAGAPPGAAQAFVDDRAAMVAHDRAVWRGAEGLGRLPAAEAAGVLSHGVDRIAAHLRDGRRFLVADEPTVCDFAAYHPLWFAMRAPALAATVRRRPEVVGWIDRLAALGHGAASRAAAADAIDAARAAAGSPSGLLPDGDWIDFHGFARGERVVVTPLDYGLVEVEGELVVSSADRIAVRRVDPRAGTVTVHFPRIGFRMARASLS
jgi:glutathione S-transferase